MSEESALWILLELSGEETAGHRAHVAECEACRGFVAALARVMEARAETELLLGMPGLADEELARLFWTPAPLAANPRPDLERVLELVGVHPSTKADACARLGELATAL